MREQGTEFDILQKEWEALQHNESTADLDGNFQVRPEPGPTRCFRAMVLLTREPGS